MPPVSTYNGKVFVDSEAPLWEWKGIGVRLNSITDCEKAKQKSQKQTQHDNETGLETAARMDANPPDQALAQFESARSMRCCINRRPAPQGKIEVNFRHAAALVLVGWYLMVPSVLPHAGPAADVPAKDLVDLDAPIEQWTQWESFDSALACQKGKTKLINTTTKGTFDDENVEWSERLAFAKCIATDDPRLKEN